MGTSSGSGAATTFVTGLATAATTTGLGGLVAGVVTMAGAGGTCTVCAGSGVTTGSGAGAGSGLLTGRGVTCAGGFSTVSTRVLVAGCCGVTAAIIRGCVSAVGVEVLITTAGAITVAATSVCSRPATKALTSS